MTFDDDLPSHVDAALPALRAHGVPATFFLSGRALNGRGAYWFQHLETLLAAHGALHTAALLGVPAGDTEALVLTCEASAAVRQRVVDLGASLPGGSVLQPDAIAALAAAGMAIGFHTVEHDPMPALADAALENAVTHGRRTLEAAAGTEVRYFAYPHGTSDARCAAAVRRAGFAAAFTGRMRPLRPGDDRYRLGRWEPGPLGIDELLVKLAVRLHRAAPEPAEPAA